MVFGTIFWIPLGSPGAPARQRGRHLATEALAERRLRSRGTRMGRSAGDVMWKPTKNHRKTIGKWWIPWDFMGCHVEKNDMWHMYPLENSDFMVISWDFMVIKWDINGIHPLVVILWDFLGYTLWIIGMSCGKKWHVTHVPSGKWWFHGILLDFMVIKLHINGIYPLVI